MNPYNFAPAYIAKCEMLHFLFAVAWVGLWWVVFSPIRTTFYKGKVGLGGMITAFLLSFCFAWASHLFADRFNLGF